MRSPMWSDATIQYQFKETIARVNNNTISYLYQYFSDIESQPFCTVSMKVSD